MKKFTDTLRENLFPIIVWGITILVAVGAYGATIGQYGDAIRDVTNKITYLEKAMVQIEIIKNDIGQMKEDIKDIKRIVLKPAIGYNGNNEGRLSSSK